MGGGYSVRGDVMDKLTDARLIQGFILSIKHNHKRIEWLLDCYPWGQPEGTACAVYDLVAGRELPPISAAAIVRVLSDYGIAEYTVEPPLELEKEDMSGRGVIV